MAKTDTFTLINTTKAKLPRLAFADMKDAVLGTDYDLTLTIIGTKEMQVLNLAHRGINAPTDILSFPLDDKNGEMFINPEYTKKESVNFDRSYENFFAFLFIHGLVHLKGIDHGSTMERIEARFRKQFAV